MGTWKIEWSFHYILLLFIGAILVGAFYRTDGRSKDITQDEARVNESFSRCNLFSGRWVFDNKSYPLYKERDCPFLLEEFSCEKYGRKDLMYQNWRWQPHDCNLPRFNAKALLERLRGKRLVFVGDSLNRNQWVSMVCLVQGVIPNKLKYFHINGSLYTFKAYGYNASIDFYWAPFLVESNCDDPINHHVPYRIAKIQSIEKHARHWIEADILIFDSYIWWLDDTMKVLLDSAENSRGVVKEMDLLIRYEMGLKTWSDWLENHVNRNKTELFFVSVSSSHLRGKEWGKGATENCYNETVPIMKEGYWGEMANPNVMRVAETTINRLNSRGLKIQILNITQLSEYRKDAHPSIYRKRWVNLTQSQLSKPTSFSDCGHWCLPGVPDTWNELLYAYLLYR